MTPEPMNPWNRQPYAMDQKPETMNQRPIGGGIRTGGVLVGFPSLLNTAGRAVASSLGEGGNSEPLNTSTLCTETVHSYRSTTTLRAVIRLSADSALIR